MRKYWFMEDDERVIAFIPFHFIPQLAVKGDFAIWNGFRRYGLWRFPWMGLGGSMSMNL
jgi:hypothetical protein